MDLFEKLHVERTPLRMLTLPQGPLNEKLYPSAEAYFLFPELEGPIGPRMTFNGKEQIVWSLNNYLGLANHPTLRTIEDEICVKWGLSYPMGARMFSGETTSSRALEEALADFVEKKAACLFNYGYQGMVSLIDTLTDFKDVILYDAQSHACIVDGIRLHQGKHLTFLHNDIENLEEQLQRATRMTEKSQGGILVITEGVFGMSGHQGKLKEIVQLKERFQFRLLVDDAHGFGTMGATGAGAGFAQGVQEDVDLYFSTFSKSLGSIGAFVAGDKETIDFIRFGIRSQMFAQALPLVFVKTNQARLAFMRQHPELVSQLKENTTKLQSGLKNLGFDLMQTNSQMTPIRLTCEIVEGARLLIDLRENFGIFCSGALFPVVPRGVFLLRVIPTAIHTQADIDESLTAFKIVKNKLDNGHYLKELDEKTLTAYQAVTLPKI